jgi:hypothetical protein
MEFFKSFFCFFVFLSFCFFKKRKHTLTPFYLGPGGFIGGGNAGGSNGCGGDCGNGSEGGGGSFIVGLEGKEKGLESLLLAVPGTIGAGGSGSGPAAETNFGEGRAWTEVFAAGVGGLIGAGTVGGGRKCALGGLLDIKLISGAVFACGRSGESSKKLFISKLKVVGGGCSFGGNGTD